MCGICGKVTLDNSPVDLGIVQGMTSGLSHRGPDDEGIHIENNVGLGHRRLSVIDLSPLAHQPMANEDGTIWIVYNGEIYNFPELREALIKRGHLFRSRSDTETIIHLYEEYGVDCPAHLRGMFAFAIWDGRERTLFLARDRVGKKPLFYGSTRNAFVFASEIKSILRDPDFSRRPDLAAIHHYLTYQYVPSPWTAFEGIRKLPPAHYLLLKNGRITTKRYWKLVYGPKHTMSAESIRMETIERLKEAVRIRLISDVPLGAFLSGGIDSSAVVAIMSEFAGGPIRTFSIGFREEAYNELHYARMISEKFGTDHREFIVDPDAATIIGELVRHYDEPFADPSAIPTYYVSKLARQHVTVALNGDGGDENFAGYGRYLANEFSRSMHRIFPAPAAKAVLPLVLSLPHGRDPNSFMWRLKRFLQEYIQPPEIRNGHWLCHFTEEMKRGIYTAGFLERVHSINSFDLLVEQYRDAEADDFLDKTLYSDVMMYLPGALLVKVDIAAMANSLETRSPFLDHEFMEFAAKIPVDLKLRGKTTKYILKEAMRGRLPEKVLSRGKMGFGVPIDCWFRNELKAMVSDVLLSDRAMQRGYFRKEAVRALIDEHVSGKWNWQYQLYNLLMLELWHRVFIDGTGF